MRQGISTAPALSTHPARCRRRSRLALSGSMIQPHSAGRGVSDRTGHSSSDQIHNYRSQARTHAELKLGGLAPLHETIPELRAAVPDPVVHQGAPPNGGTSGERAKKGENQVLSQTDVISSGESGIRTHGTLTGTPDFESGTFGHSVISPPRKMHGEVGPVNPSFVTGAANGRWPRRGRSGRRRSPLHLSRAMTPATSSTPSSYPTRGNR
jgi:hypothetical protein